MPHTGGGKAKLRRGRNQKMRSDQAGGPPQKPGGPLIKSPVHQLVTDLRQPCICDGSPALDYLVIQG